MHKLLFGCINTSMGTLLDSEVTHCKFMVVMEVRIGSVVCVIINL